MHRLGLLTLGQSPRPDGLFADVSAVVGPGVEILEYGALDGLDQAGIAGLAPQGPGPVLVTLLRTGLSVSLDRARFLPHLQTRLHDLDRAGAEGVVLLCTGDFPELRSSCPLVIPHALLYQIARGLLPAGETMGVLMPLSEQLPAMEREFAALGVRVIAASASPYGDEEGMRHGARALHSNGASLVYMDCFGYRASAKQAVKEEALCPVVLARTMAARLMAEFIE